MYAEQVAMLYAGARTAALANMANAAILAFLLWGTAPPRLLHGWLAAMVLVQLVRLGLASLYRRAQPSAYGMKAGNWDQWYLASAAAGGATWGTAGFWLFPQQAVELQLALIFVIAGTVAGATALLAPVLSAFSFFALPALVPLSLRFILEDTPHSMAMAVLTLIFLLVLLSVVRIIHATILSSIQLRMENKDLVAALTSKANNLQQVNRLLGTQIIEHKAVQEQFREQFVFLQQLIDAIPNPVFYKDPNGTYQGCNEALTRFLGISKSDFVDKTVFDMVSRELAEEHTSKDRELLEHGGVQIYESPVRAADGTTRHILFHKTLFRDPLDRIIGIIGTLVDLTEREAAESALRQTQEQLHLALNAGNAGLWSWDIKTNAVYISPSWKAQLGYADEQIHNRYEEFESRLHPDDRDRVIQQNMAFTKTPSSGYRSEFRLRHKDGSYRWIVARADIYAGVDGQRTWFTGCNIDVTERKRAEEALRQERDLSREYLDIAGVMILVLNTDQTVRLINKKGCEILGCPSVEIVGKRWVDHFLPERDRTRLDCLFDELKAGKPLELVENAVLTKDGRERMISWHNTVLRDAGGAITGTLSSGEDITERKRAEVELSQSREMLRQIVDNIPQHVFWKDRNSNYLGCNKLFAQAAGITEPGAIVGKNDFELPWKGSAELYRTDDRAVMETKLPKLNFEESMVTPDGTSLVLRTSKVPLQDRTGQVFGVLGVFEDISVEKAEQQRQEEELRLKSFSSDVGTALTISATLGAGLHACTEAMVRHLGAAFARVWILDPAQNMLVLQTSTGMYTNIEGRHHRIPVGQYKIGLIAQEKRAHLTNDVVGDPRVHDQEWARQEGMVAFAGYPLLVEGRVLGVMAMFARKPLSELVLQALQTVAHGVAQFIERKQVEAQFRLVTSALEASANGVTITDAEGAIQWVNQAFTKLTGYRAEEVVGQNPRVLKSNQQEPQFYRRLWETIKAGDIWHGELMNKRKDGSLYPEEMTITPVRNLQGAISHFIAVKQDITQRREMQARTSRMERLATLGQLVGSIAHEMKNPLFMLTGRLQLLREKLAQQDYGSTSDDLQKIDSAASRMKEIAERFLTLAKPVGAALEPTAVQTVLKQALEAMENDLGRNHIKVKAVIAPDLPTTQADPHKLHEAFTNLITNAMQAMAEAHGRGVLSVSAALEKDWIQVRIADDGPGIAPEHRARLFEPFFTTKPAGRGAGLGLWAVRTTMMESRGTVACETEAGRGATFIMRLPIMNVGDPT